MQQLDEAHRILRDKLETSQQRQMTQLTNYYLQLESSLLTPDPISPITAPASRSSTIGRSAGPAVSSSLRKL